MDNYIVSARKYRPSTFHSVIGQKSLTTTLKNAILNQKLAHAYLFCGPRGVGKTTCARIFAKTINCFNPTAEGEACNECESCRSFNENRSLNIHELDAASNNSVDDIRSLTEQVRIMPQLGKYKVYIIDEVHMLSPAAFNAFLKTLEEPPKHAIFILATTEKHKILPTILSRCQIYDFSRISLNDISGYLAYVATQEKVSFENEALNVIAQKADGGMRDALSIFDQVVSFSQGNVTYKTVIENLNVLDYDYYFKITEAILRNDVPANMMLLNEILSNGFDGQQILSGLSLFFRDLLVCRDPQTIVLFELSEAVKEKYLTLAKQCPQAFLYKAMEITNEIDLSYRLNRNKRFAIELLLIRLCQLNLSSSDSEEKKKIVIEPLSVTEQPLKPAPNIVKTTAVTPQSQQPDKTFARISINSATVSKKQEMPAVETASKPLQNQSFNQETLQKAWREFAAGSTDAYLKSAMQYINPLLKDEYVIEIEALNLGQGNVFQKKITELKTFFVSFLKNDSISISLKIKEEESKESLYTPKEKFNYMSEQNPALRNLVQEFELRLN
ncbi:MAG: DNA polymerase III subunit gamma/tau [Dysgonamonadaceae bacterium]|jgi:DNA polymerase-3 subunit gamma/tau|nr:DNA polymerase III subunit gamma/tau [Dysgonamonadaceae bacterium]